MENPTLRWISECLWTSFQCNAIKGHPMHQPSGSCMDTLRHARLWELVPYALHNRITPSATLNRHHFPCKNQWKSYVEISFLVFWNCFLLRSWWTRDARMNVLPRSRWITPFLGAREKSLQAMLSKKGASLWALQLGWFQEVFPCWHCLQCVLLNVSIKLGREINENNSFLCPFILVSAVCLLLSLPRSLTWCNRLMKMVVVVAWDQISSMFECVIVTSPVNMEKEKAQMVSENSHSTTAQGLWKFVLFFERTISSVKGCPFVGWTLSLTCLVMTNIAAHWLAVAPGRRMCVCVFAQCYPRQVTTDWLTTVV